MQNLEIERIETDLLLEAIFQRWGYDFRSYGRASIERRVRQLQSKTGCQSISDMIPKVLHDEAFLSNLVQGFSIPVTKMFRDPPVYRAVREKVMPLLRTWPHLKVWHAGCATGEEAYSLAIVFAEQGLYDRTTFYATDFNDRALEEARAGVYAADRIQEATRNYQLAGGTASLSEYYHSRYDAAVINRSLRERITFANHNLATDGVFGEMHVVFCRNVLIYFNRALQNRALRVFTESLVFGGFLCLGAQENLLFTEVDSAYEELDQKARIYRKRLGQ